MTTEKRNNAKNCPDCGQPLTIRTNRNTGEDFLGCSDWPGCSYTEVLPEDIIMIRQNAAQLPGFQAQGTERPFPGADRT